MKARLLAALLALAATAGCGQVAAADGKVPVVTAFYPLQYLSRRIGGDTVTVADLTKPGAEPHDVELSPRQVGHIADAALVVYLKGFQPAVDQAVAQEAKGRAFDAGSVVPLLAYGGDEGHRSGEREAAAGNTDPHFWLDPVRYATVAGDIGARLAAVDPANAAGYTARAAAVQAELAALDRTYAQALRTCARREIVTSHEAFRYLAERYRLAEIGITGVSPEAEPSPGRLAEVAGQARRTGATTIFFETLVSPKVAETLAGAIGAKAAVLDPLEGITEPGADYFSVMRDNLTALTLALGCAE
jgi:zinc transport system substrate-binding protein